MAANVGKRLANPPWRRVPKAQFEYYVLRRWRAFADWAARAKGGRRACGLCKRATQGQASVSTMTPWPSYKARKRWLCSECWDALVDHLNQREYDLDHYDLPIDRVSRSDTTGSGQRGTYTKR